MRERGVIAPYSFHTKGVGRAFEALRRGGMEEGGGRVGVPSSSSRKDTFV